MDLRRRVGQVKNLCLIACLLLAAFTAQAVAKDWNGSVSTNWDTPANWTPAGAPTAADDVQIKYASNQPVIGANTAALAQSVWVEGGTSLTIFAMGSLTINGSRYFFGFTAGFFNQGTVSNTGKMILGSTTSLGHYGILNASAFNNNSGGEISIDRSANRALFNNNGTFTNSAKITIGAVADVGFSSIYNNSNATFNNNSCTALINIVANAVINNLGPFNNSGNIIENAAGSSSVTTNSGVIQNLNGGTFTVTGSNTGVNATATGAIWTGCDDTNWANAYNWNKLTAPVASQDVTIPHRSHDPVILGGTAAVAKSVVVQADASLELSASSSLSISGATADGLSSEGAVINAGLLSISSAGGIGFYNGGTFNNNGAGELRINGTVGEGLFQWDATLNNAAKIKIGNTGSIGGYGINNRYSTINNNAGGDLTVDRTAESGIFVFTGSLNNVANITIGGLATVGGNGILNGEVINNNTGGSILIDRTVGSGLHVSFATFNNSASLKIGSTASIGFAGISCQSGRFNNFPGGEITIDRTTSDGITNYYGSPYREFGNSGKIFIGKTAAIGGYGILNEAAFNNNSDGEITIDRTANSGVYVGDDNDSNTRPAVFSNSGKLTIGSTAALGDNGIQNRVTFHNNASGQIWIDRTDSDGLFNAAGNFNNAGQVTIGAIIAPTGDGLENAATFHNQACGEIALHDNLINDGAFTNAGLLRIHTTLSQMNSGTFTNDGILEYPQGSLIPNVTNNGVIVKAVVGECPVANVLELGGSNNFTIGNTWFKNVHLTEPAGTYNQVNNIFNINELMEGVAQTLYFTINDDANDCLRTVSVNLTYDDLTAPTITCPADLTVAADGACSATIGDYRGLATHLTDNCTASGSITVVQSPSANTLLSGHNDVEIVTLKSDDGHGNQSQPCTFQVILKDITPPTITCPANIAKTTDPGQCSAVTYYTVTASDHCIYTTTPTNGFASGTAFPTGAHVVNWQVTDAAGWTAICSFTVTVTDGQAPSIICPANLIKTTDLNQCTAVVTYAAPMYSDNCSNANIQRVSGPASGGVFPKGTTMVNWQATDAWGNSSLCGFTVTVNDGQAPGISCPLHQTRSADPGQCQASVTYTTPTATDNCSLAPALMWVSGGTSPNASGANSVAVFQKGATTVTWKATDGANLTKTCTFRVTVNDTEAPAITCPVGQSVNTAAGACASAAVTYATPSATDNCASPAPVVTRVSGPASGSNFPKGVSNVTWRAMDAAGNTKTCSFAVTVTDNVLPGIACPAAIAASGTVVNGVCSAVVTYANATATDNCAVASVVLQNGGASGSNFPEGATVNVWRAMDDSGLTATCSFTVTVSCGTGSEPAAERSEKLIVNSEQLGAQTAMTLAPNPATTEVQIRIEHLGDKGGDLRVLDAQGRLVWQRRFGPEALSGEQQMTVTLGVSGEKFAAGLYFVTLRSEGQKVTKRLVVTRI